MAGSPIRQAAFRRFDAVEEEIFDAVADKVSILSIAKKYGKVKSRRPFYDWLNKNPELKARFKEIRSMAGHTAAEEATEILDKAAKKKDLTTQEVQLARERARHREWLASRWNREAYGDTPAISVGLNLNAENIGLTWVEVLRGNGNGQALPTERRALPESVTESGGQSGTERDATAGAGRTE